MRTVLFGFILAMTAIFPCRAETGGIVVDGVARSYIVHAPQKMPAHPALILAFHGGGGTAAGMEKLTRFDALADAQGFIVVYPQGLQRHWNDGRDSIKVKTDDVGFVAALIPKLVARYGVDPKRVYATGMSNGAIFANTLGCRLSGQIAAIAPVAGSLAADMTPQCAPAKPVSVLLIAGTADPIVPYDGGDVKNFHGRGEGGSVLGAPRTEAFWKIVDHCGAADASATPPPLVADDPTRLQISKATGCPPGLSVELISVQGAGHVWPGGAQYLPRFIIGPGSWQMDASAVIAAFFLAHPAP